MLSCRARLPAFRAGDKAGVRCLGGPGRGGAARAHATVPVVTVRALNPDEALERIAYLLERAREPTHRIRAFRRAAAVARQAGPERLDQLAKAGQLRVLPGIGDSTERVIQEALAGRVPAYLERLEERPEAEPEPGVRELLDAIQGDCHGHSDWSDGGSPVEDMARAALALGHRYGALTDHSPRLTVAHGLDAGRLREQIDLVGRLNEQLAAEADFRVLTGIEVDILEDGSLDQDETLLEELDVVVASVHSKLRMDEVAMTARMLRAVASPHVDILGHCTGRMVVGRGRPESRFDAAAVFAACAESGTAVEVNCRPERLDPPMRLLGEALSAGCLLSIDTDAHAPGQLEWQVYGAERVARVGADPDRVINTWPRDRLLDWLRAPG